MTTHTITLARHTAQVVGLMGVLVLGTCDSYGTEQLLLRHGPEWEGLAIDATFHNTPSDEGVTVLADTDGLVTVPPEACMRASKYATITIRGVQDGVQRISCNLPYMVLDHAQVPGANSTATPSENAQALAQMQDLRDGAVDAKRHAEAARDGAAKSAAAAAASEEAAASSAVAAAGSAAQAEAQKTAAAKSASDAQGYMQTASDAATAANASAENAAASADKANAGETAAAASASNAVASASNAAASAASAATAASDAQGYMQTASGAATAANASAKNAEGSKAAAASSATAAAASATTAAGDAKTASDAAAGAADAKAAAMAAQKDAAASKAAAANSAAAAKASEDAAAKSAADADSTANSIKDSMTQIAALQKRQNVLAGSETGNPASCDDAFAAPLCGLNVYGKSTQNGTPSPDTPVPIVSAGDSGSVTVKVTGKNLLQGISKILSPSEVIEGGVRIINNTGGNSRLAFFTAELKKGVQYTIRYNEKLVQGTNIKVSIYLPNITQYVANTFIPRQDTDIIGIYLNSKEIGTVEVTDIQLELGSTATAYSPYREQLLTLSTPNGLPGIPVTSGGNYIDQNGQQWVCDEVDLERGVLVQRIGKAKIKTVSVSKDSKWYDANKSYSYEISQFTLPFSSNAKHIAKDLCNRFIMKIFGDFYNRGIETGGLANQNYAVFNISKALGICTTVEEFKTWFSENVVLYKILATPIETTLTPAEIAAYKALTAYAPDTVVQASDGAGVKLEYQRDVNIAIKKLEDAIASMTAT